MASGGLILISTGAAREPEFDRNLAILSYKVRVP